MNESSINITPFEFQRGQEQKIDTQSNDGMSPLQSATTEELWKELSHRFSGAVLVFDAPQGQLPGKASAGIWWHSCSIAHSFGLASYAHSKFQDAIMTPPNINIHLQEEDPDADEPWKKGNVEGEEP